MLTSAERERARSEAAATVRSKLASVKKRTPDFLVVQHDVVDVKGAVGVELTVAEPANCGCKDYEGQDFHCHRHVATNLCPNCDCVQAERLIPGACEPMNQYQCNVCGRFYMRNMVTGSYEYSK